MLVSPIVDELINAVSYTYSNPKGVNVNKSTLENWQKAYSWLRIMETENEVRMKCAVCEKLKAGSVWANDGAANIQKLVIDRLTMTDIRQGKTSRRNVLIAMDGSKHALFAFEWYAENVYKETDNVIMAYCVEYNINIPTTVFLASPSTVEMMVEQYEDTVKQVLTKLDLIANKYNIKHTVQRLELPNRPGEAIVKAAHHWNVDLIVTGTRGLGTIRRTIMGSVSDYIIHHAHVPVIVCKHADEHHKLK